LKEVFASFDERFIEQFLKLEPGETLAIHGKIVGLSLTAWASDCCCYLSLSLSDCAFSKPPLGQTPKPTSRLATPKPKRTDEDRARSQLSLARSYIGAGLKAKALNVLKTLIKKYPKTHAARTAAEELKKLGKQ
jgi:hypothetical protein